MMFKRTFTTVLLSATIFNVSKYYTGTTYNVGCIIKNARFELPDIKIKKTSLDSDIFNGIKSIAQK